VSNQFEINPFLFRKNTIDYFQKEGLVLHSYVVVLRPISFASSEAVVNSRARDTFLPTILCRPPDTQTQRTCFVVKSIGSYGDAF